MASAQHRAYGASLYWIGNTPLRIGRRDARLDALLATRDAVLLTACNPRSRRMPPGWNERVMRRLMEALRRRDTLAGESGTGRWREAQILVACPHGWGLRLARRFRQNAVVTLRRHQPPRLVAVLYQPVLTLTVRRGPGGFTPLDPPPACRRRRKLATANLRRRRHAGGGRGDEAPRLALMDQFQSVLVLG